MIKVRVVGSLTKYTSGKSEFAFSLSDCSSTETVKLVLGIPKVVQTVITINHKRCQTNQPLVDGDVVMLITPISGG